MFNLTQNIGTDPGSRVATSTVTILFACHRALVRTDGVGMCAALMSAAIRKEDEHVNEYLPLGIASRSRSSTATPPFTPTENEDGREVVGGTTEPGELGNGQHARVADPLAD